jgi:hypothetical protein
MKNQKINNHSKDSIKHVHNIVKDYFKAFATSDEHQEEIYYEFLQRLEREEISIPAPIYNTIETFVKSTLEPMVEDYDTVFHKANSIGTLKDGVRHLNNEIEAKTALGEFWLAIIEIEKKWDDFAMKELHPYLIA